jgi:ELWxxDGT repeat protein
MSTTNALRNSFLRLGFVALAAFLASCEGDGAAAPAVRYFTAAGNGGKDFELRKTDRTEAGTVRVEEINPGAGGSRPLGFAVFNNAVYFSAFDGTSGFELWKSDGTEAGTVRVKDINPGANGSIPGGFTVFNNTLYFSAFDGTSGFELWKSDGTEAGTVRVR